MPIYKQLPEIFGMTDGTIPFRIYLYAADFLNDGRFQKVEACPMSPDNNAIVVEDAPSGVFTWDIRAGIATSRALYWETGYRIQSNNNLCPTIPILDFMDKGFLFQNIYTRGHPLQRVENLFAAEIHRKCRDIRSSIQTGLYSIGNLQVQQLQPSAPPPSPEPVIPNHVLTALIRSAIADGKSCPISLVDFEDTCEFGITTCFHLFEKESIEKWLSTNTTCPECRKPCTSASYIKKTQT